MHKLARSVGMLSKVRHYVQQNELKNIYHSILESHLRYGCQIWFLSSSKFIKDKIKKLQKKALCPSLTFEPHLRHSLKKGKSSKITVMDDLQNCLLCHSFLNGKLPIFKNAVMYTMLLHDLASLNLYTCRALKVLNMV